jgi:hypothetical protein
MNALEPHYSVKQVAEAWNINKQTVRRLFDGMPGVLRISQPVLLQRKRKPRVTLRVPASLVDRAYEQWSGGLQRKVQRGGRSV